MAETLPCAHCHSKLKLRPEYAGKRIKCPKCAHVMVVPANPGVMALPAGKTPKRPRGEKIVSGPPTLPGPADEAAIEEEGIAATPSHGKPHKAPCPECGKMVDDTARKCPYCKTPLEVDEEVEYRRWKKCPRCGEKMAKRVLWTFWGSFYFTALFKHVRCENCGATYNGKTGRSNILAAVLCVGVVLLLIAGVIGAIFWILHSRGRL